MLELASLCALPECGTEHRHETLPRDREIVRGGNEHAGKKNDHTRTVIGPVSVRVGVLVQDRMATLRYVLKSPIPHRMNGVKSRPD